MDQACSVELLQTVNRVLLSTSISGAEGNWLPSLSGPFVELDVTLMGGQVSCRTLLRVGQSVSFSMILRELPGESRGTCVGACSEHIHRHRSKNGWATSTCRASPKSSQDFLCARVASPLPQCTAERVGVTPQPRGVKPPPLDWRVKVRPRWASLQRPTPCWPGGASPALRPLRRRRGRCCRSARR